MKLPSDMRGQVGESSGNYWTPPRRRSLVARQLGQRLGSRDAAAPDVVASATAPTSNHAAIPDFIGGNTGRNNGLYALGAGDSERCAPTLKRSGASNAYSYRNSH